MEFTTSFGKNELILSPAEIKSIYLYGVSDLLSKNGKILSDESYRYYIRAAQDEIENFLNIRFRKQIIVENLSFFRDEFVQFGFIRTTYPANEALGLDGYLGTIRQIEYPSEWLATRRTNDGYSYFRNIYIVPNVGTARTGSIVYNGVIPYIGISSYDQVPNYWTVKYVTGFDKVPQDLMGIVGKLAAINILLILGNLVLGKPGVSSQSLGIDGLSQSLSSQLNPFGPQIKQYKEDIQTTLSRVASSYKGITMTSL